MRQHPLKIAGVFLLLITIASVAHAGFFWRLIFVPAGAYGGLYLGTALMLASFAETADFDSFGEALAGSLVYAILAVVVGGGAGAIAGGFIGYWVGRFIDAPGGEDLGIYYRREVAPHLGLCRRSGLFTFPLLVSSI